MKTFTGIAEARDELQDFYYSHKNDLPPFLAEKLAPLFRTGTSPVDAIVNAAEAIYASEAGIKPKALHDEAVLLAAGLADVRDRDGYHTPPNDAGRAAKLRNALRRAGGEAAPGKAANDPTPLPEFVEPAEEEEAPAEPAEGE